VAVIDLVRGADGRVSATGAARGELGHRVRHADGTCDGIYAGWRWDGGALAIEQDRYGFHPLFAWTTPARVVLAASVAALLDAGAPRDLDHEALSVFLRVGFFLGDDTPFRAIRALPPQAALRWSDSGPALDGAPPRMPPPQSITRDQAIDELIVRFRAAMARRAPQSPFELPLSGGRDSRHILFELSAAGTLPRACVTVEHFPPRGNDDVAIAGEVCRRLRLPHVVIRQDADRAGAEREKNVRTHYCSDEHSQFVVLARHLRASTAATYDGIAGDVLSQSSYLNAAVQALVERRDALAIARYVLDGYGVMVTDAALARLLAPAVWREVPRERAEARLAREIARHLDAPNPVSSFFFWNRARREIALGPYALMRDVTVYAPYLDRQVFELLASLPASLEMDRRLHTDAIARAFPQHADIPYERKTARSRRPWLQRRLAASLARDVVANRGLLRARTLLPGVLATVADGNAERLWHTALTVYLAQLGALASRAR
jgi:asparagine synthetase B (glutamine-hydrolysing)